MENEYIRLVPADVSLAEQVVDYYRRNRGFLQAYEPVRGEEFYSLEYQKQMLAREALDFREGRAYRFYLQPKEQPEIVIGTIGLTNVVMGAFCSAFLGYKLDEKYLNRGYMTMALSMLVPYAFNELHLHRIEGNVMPRNKASLRVLEKNHFVNEGLSKSYLNINGVWEDHIHMVRLNHSMH